MKSNHAARVIAFQDFKRALPPLTAVLEHYGVLAGMKKIGTQLYSSCPIHGGSGGHKKQFVVNPETNEWKCFSPRHQEPSGGSTLEFVMAMQNCDLNEARRHIARWFAMPSPTSSSQHTKRRRSVMSEGNQPTHRVYSAKRRDGAEKDDLTMIGSGWVFNTKNGKAGMNIQLNALPTGDRMVIFERDPEWEEKHWKQEEPPKENGKSFAKKK